MFETLGPNDPKLTSADHAMSETVATYWTNFAKTGNPNGDGVPAWPEFTEGDQRAMYFHNGAQPGPVPGLNALEVLDSYFAWRRTPEGAAWAQ